MRVLSILFCCERTKRVGLHPWRWTNERGAPGDAGGEKKSVFLAKPAERERETNVDKCSNSGSMVKVASAYSGLKLYVGSRLNHTQGSD